MANAFFDGIWWLVFAAVGIGLGWWINSHVKFDSANRLIVASGRALVFLMSLVFAAVLIILFIEVLITSLY